MDLGPHAAFIWISYAIFAAVLATLIGWLWRDGQDQQQRLARLEAQGIKRRTSQPLSAGATPAGRDGA